MGIYIPGMKMPKDCRECPLFGYTAEDDFMCLIQDGEDACPLIELPPHGRLIDADALKKQAGEFCDPMGFIPGVAVEDIDDAPTIISADGGEKV